MIYSRRPEPARSAIVMKAGHILRWLNGLKGGPAVWAAGVALFAAAATVESEDFAIDWFTIAGGGGVSANGPYVLHGTIGQADAGPVMTGGTFALTGGFWALPVLVPTLGAPTLHITNGPPGFATIWWSPPTPGFTLEVSPALAPADWTGAATGTNNPALVPLTPAPRFYRLLKL